MGLERYRPPSYFLTGPREWTWGYDPNEKNSPWRLRVHLPLRKGDATKVDWSKPIVFCVINDDKRPMTSEEWKILAEILSHDPYTVLSVSDLRHAAYNDFKFLEFLREHRAFAFHIRGAETYGCLPEIVGNLGSLSLEFTRKKLPLNFLRDAQNLRYLSLNHVPSAVPYISELKSLERLELISSPGKNTLKSFPKNLKALEILGGSLPSYEILLTAPKLEHLFLYQCRIDGDIAPLGELKNLRQLTLSHQHGQELPNLSKLKKLEYFYLGQMKGVTSLEVVTKLKNLKQLFIEYMPDLEPEKLGDLSFYDKIPLARFACGYKRFRKWMETEVFPKYPHLEWNSPPGGIIGAPQIPSYGGSWEMFD